MESKPIHRIGLSSQACDLLSKEVQVIREKGSHFKVNESKLASVIIELFFERYSEAERKKVEKKFFDGKTYLAALIREADSEETLNSSLNSYLGLSRPKRRKALVSDKGDQS